MSGREDYEVVARELIEKEKCRITLIDEQSGDQEQTSPLLDNEALKAAGFDGYIGDFLDAPGPVMSILRSKHHIHRTVIILLFFSFPKRCSKFLIVSLAKKFSHSE